MKKNNIDYMRIVKAITREHSPNYGAYKMGDYIYIWNNFETIKINRYIYNDYISGKADFLPDIKTLISLEKNSRGVVVNCQYRGNRWTEKRNEMNVSDNFHRTLAEMLDYSHQLPAVDTFIERKATPETKDRNIRYIVNSVCTTTIDADIWDGIVKALNTSKYEIFSGNNDISPVILSNDDINIMRLPIRVMGTKLGDYLRDSIFNKKSA